MLRTYINFLKQLRKHYRKSGNSKKKINQSMKFYLTRNRSLRRGVSDAIIDECHGGFDVIAHTTWWPITGLP